MQARMKFTNIIVTGAASRVLEQALDGARGGGKIFRGEPQGCFG